MREILVKPDIYKFRTFAELSENFAIGERDLVLTTRLLKEKYIEPVMPGLPCLVQEDFGTGEPTEEMIEKMLPAADFDSYDRVIAIGGGTMMDIGKIFAVRRTGSVNDLFFGRAPLYRDKKLICVPTTCGTGSEVTMTSVAIVREPGGGTTKLGLLDEKLIADTAVLIPQFIEEIPHKPMAESLIDALIHATESYLSPDRATMTTDTLAEKAIKLILEAMAAYGKGIDIRKEYADEMLTAACYAGLAFLSAGCGLVHGMSYPLSGKYFVTHGAANYVFFDAVLKYYDMHDSQSAGAGRSDGCDTKGGSRGGGAQTKMSCFRAMVADALGCDEADAIEALAKAEDALIPVKTMREYGAEEPDIDQFTKSVFANQMRLVNNAYAPVGPEEVRELYRQVM